MQTDTLMEALGRAGAARTTLIIAHRLSTARLAVRIIVLDHGRMIEQGTHEELLALNGRYAHLCRLQMSNEAKKARVQANEAPSVL